MSNLGVCSGGTTAFSEIFAPAVLFTLFLYNYYCYSDGSHIFMLYAFNGLCVRHYGN